MSQRNSNVRVHEHEKAALDRVKEEVEVYEHAPYGVILEDAAEALLAEHGVEGEEESFV